MTGRSLLEAGRLAEARVAFWEEAGAAEAAGDPLALAEAALGLGGIWVHEHRTALEQARVTALQRRALADIDPASPTAHRLRVRLAAETAYATGDPAPVLAELAAARRLADPVVVAEAISLTHHCVLGPQHAGLRAELSDELIAVSPATGRAVDGVMGLAWRTIDLFLAGDRRAGRSLAELRAALDGAPCDGVAYAVAAIDVMLAMRDGNLAGAAALAERCYELGTAVGDADALGWHGAQLVAIRWLEGRAGEVLPLVRDLASSPTVAEPCTAFVAATASLAAATGDSTTAAVALASLRAVGLATLPSTSHWSATLVAACDAAHALGDAAAAAEAYEVLAPYADLPAMASLAVACFGSAHRPLGLAALTMDRLDVAIGHFEAAVLADLALGHRPAHAISRAALADALDQRGDPGDDVRAAELRAGAIADARRLGMEARADRWAARPGAEDITFQRAGRLWWIRSGERTTVVPHTVGMGYLTRLVEHRDVEITSLELASGLALGPGGATPVLDEAAKAAYRRRIEELRAEVDDAESCADLARAERARDELDRVIEEIGRATGLAGRVRPFADEAERARVSVHKAIRRALATIAEIEPDLGRQLEARVVTGARCVYRSAA